VKSKRHLIIVDEASMVPLRIWAALAAFRFTGARFIVLGDVPGQLPPIADKSRELLWSSIDSSRFMHELCGGFKVQLRKFRRGGDSRHFDIVGSIYPGRATLAEALEKVRAEYPRRRALEENDTVLCVSNQCRIQVNARLNQFHAKEDAVLVAAASDQAGAQDMRLWPGIVLQSAVTDRKNLRNALRYRVVAVDQGVTRLVRVDDRQAVVGEEFAVPTPEVPIKLRLCYAITYDSSQARTLVGNVRLAQTGHAHFSLRRLIVGLGRAPEGSQIEVE